MREGEGSHLLVSCCLVRVEKRAADEEGSVRKQKSAKVEGEGCQATTSGAGKTPSTPVDIPNAHVVTLGKASLRLAITVGQYGPIVRLMRGERFITYSGGLWLKIRRYVPQMKQIGFHLQLTADKDVSCETFDQNGKTYVKFHAQWDASQWDGKGHTFINFDEEEWLGFVRALHKVDNILPCPVVEECDACSVIKQVVYVRKDGRVCATALEADALKAIQQSNAKMPDPFYRQCEYCGEVEQGRCHCHEEECRECCADNFCDTCGACKVLAVEAAGEGETSNN